MSQFPRRQSDWLWSLGFELTSTHETVQSKFVTHIIIHIRQKQLKYLHFLVEEHTLKCFMFISFQMDTCTVLLVFLFCTWWVWLGCGSTNRSSCSRIQPHVVMLISRIGEGKSKTELRSCTK